MQRRLRWAVAVAVAFITGQVVYTFADPPESSLKADPKASQVACDSLSFIEAAQQAELLRKDRRLSAEAFAKAAKEPNTIVLDARNEEAHRLLRVKNSVNLPYTSFTESDLAEVIPTKQTRVLIYCRNNIADKAPEGAERKVGELPYPNDFGNKIRVKGAAAGLNIPTYITLYIYGYKNVWELDPVVDPNASAIEFESSATEPLAVGSR